ncbi:hypothetical protein JZ751_001883, partial [Albula glossodonta]
MLPSASPTVSMYGWIWHSHASSPSSMATTRSFFQPLYYDKLLQFPHTAKWCVVCCLSLSFYDNLQSSLPFSLSLPPLTMRCPGEMAGQGEIRASVDPEGGGGLCARIGARLWFSGPPPNTPSLLLLGKEGERAPPHGHRRAAPIPRATPGLHFPQIHQWCTKDFNFPPSHRIKSLPLNLSWDQMERKQDLSGVVLNAGMANKPKRVTAKSSPRATVWALLQLRVTSKICSGADTKITGKKNTLSNKATVQPQGKQGDKTEYKTTGLFQMVNKAPESEQHHASSTLLLSLSPAMSLSIYASPSSSSFSSAERSPELCWDSWPCSVVLTQTPEGSCQGKYHGNQLPYCSLSHGEEKPIFS